MRRIDRYSSRPTFMLLSLGAALACSDESEPASPTVPGDSLPPPGLALEAELAFSGFDAPLLLIQPPGDERLLVVEQPGRVRAVAGTGPASTPYLDLTDRVAFGGERGLLGLAFHPDFASNGRVYASFSDAEGDTRLERFQDPGDGRPIDPASAVEVFSLPQPFSNHNGGHIAFGPDGFLYLGLGDGGQGGDPLNSGQDSTTLLGAMLRLDVDVEGAGYRSPPGNPFVALPGVPDEIWAYGLRNPWRFSFDGTLLYIGDVGQNTSEEISVVDTGSGGYNFGWNLKEGDLCFAVTPCDRDGLTDPVLTYPNGSVGCSVTGGVVYRGSAIPELAGTYLYSDFCGGWLRGFRFSGGVATERTTWIADPVGRVTSFGTDARGEVYLLTAEGDVFRVVRS